MGKDMAWQGISVLEQSDDYKLRLKGEYCGLVKRIHELKNFIRRAENQNARRSEYVLPPPKVEPNILSSMKTQLEAMEKYRDALKYRAEHEGISI